MYALIGGETVELSLSHIILFGLILGGTSPAVIVPLVRMLPVSESVQAFLVVESTVSEMCTVISVVLMAGILSTFGPSDDGTLSSAMYEETHSIVGPVPDVSEGTHAQERDPPSRVELAISAINQVVIAVLIAFLASLAWNIAGNVFRSVPLSYMMILAFLCILYVLVHTAGGEPIIAVFVFGFLMGNTRTVVRWLAPFTRRLLLPKNWTRPFEFDAWHLRLNTEMSFLARVSFFFVMGMMLDFPSWGWDVYIMAGLITVGLLASRKVYTRWIVVRKQYKVFHDDNTRGSLGLMGAMMPRGLACATVTVYAIEAQVLSPDTVLLSIIWGVILLSNLTMGVSLQRHRRGIQKEHN